MLLHGFAIDLASFLLELQHVGEGGEEWRGKKDTGYLYKAFRRCWRMQALRDGARTQGDRSRQPGKPTHPCIVGAGLAPALPRCPCPAALHSFFHSPAESFLVARRPPSRITGDDDAHDPCDCDHPYRTVCSPVNTQVHQDARNRSGAKPPAARGCPLACSISQEEA